MVSNMEVKATVLCENTVYGLGGIAEHGWAVWLETAFGNFLFDTGQGKALLHNATFFGKDLASTRSILISHHHYDHTGGLLEALRLMRGGPKGTGVPVLAQFDLFKDSYSMPKGKKPRHIGIPFSRAVLEGVGASFSLDNDWREIEERIYLTGEVPRRTDFERGDPDLKHFDEEGELVIDPIRDDQTLVIETRQGLFAVLGCSHAGVINILNYIVERTGRSDFHTIIGGTHLGPSGEERVSRTIEALLTFDIQRIGVSHCTGQKPAAQLALAFGDRFFLCNVGTEVEV
jgi:7,8-dihydropterin-6-yl-methyl-4-(beta-D-ribofuranosyl)aminobenzene 5'-phosphate synthase